MSKDMIILPINLQLFAEGVDIDTGVDVGVADQQTDTNIDTDTSSDDLGAGVSENNGDVATTKPKQSPEVDSAFAEMRRKADAAEKKAIELEAKRNQDREITRKYGAEYGVYSEEDISEKFGASHGIHTVDDLQRAILNEQYREKGIDPDEINKLIENHPLIQEATKIKENTVISNQYNSLLADLKEDGLEGLVKKADDIPDEVYERWNYGKNNLTLSECFYIAHRKQISAKKADATKQNTLNNLSGKAHLKVEGDGGADATDVSVPAETLAMYMDMGMSKKEASAHYKKLYGG